MPLAPRQLEGGTRARPLAAAAARGDGATVRALVRLARPEVVAASCVPSFLKKEWDWKRRAADDSRVGVRRDFLGFERRDGDVAEAAPGPSRMAVRRRGTPRGTSLDLVGLLHSSPCPRTCLRLGRLLGATKSEESQRQSAPGRARGRRPRHLRLPLPHGVVAVPGEGRRGRRAPRPLLHPVHDHAVVAAARDGARRAVHYRDLTRLWR